MKQSVQAEKSVNHHAVTLELFTKAYEYFKKSKGQRTTLYLALEIAKLHESMGSHELAIQLLNHICNTYRKEKWSDLLKASLNNLLDAARKSGNWTVVLKTLFEMVSKPLLPAGEKERSSLAEEMMQLLGQTQRPNYLQDILGKLEHDHISLDMTLTPSFLGCFVQMKRGQVFVSDSVEYQVTFHPTSTTLPKFSFSLARIHIEFSNPQYNTVISHQETDAADLVIKLKHKDILHAENVEFARFGSPPQLDSASLDLRFKPAVAKVFEGSVKTLVPEDIEITKVTGVFESPQWTVALDFNDLTRHRDQQRWLSNTEANGFEHLERRDNPALCRVTRRKPKLQVTLEHATSGYLQELFPVKLHLKNDENEDVLVNLEVRIKSADAEIGTNSNRAYLIICRSSDKCI